ncbi:two-component sensor histidine kinase [Streptomyces sp. CB02923]|uniref:sensor histidine kinase n=1 Tax=Streptomyces sp. CB02923 TaxID=1718985 RepID=UPI0009391828|nr:ATP-binding protein [Streptomyces sp. CB02923]OKI09470.1 two-component sensor histidine kinase [Streptomyces sp. CB02923]
MGDDVKPAGGKRRAGCVVLVAMILLPALGASPGAFPLALCAAVAAAAAMPGLRLRRVPLVRGAVFTASASLVLDFAYSGDPKPIGFWLPFEGVALLVLLYRVTRREPVPRAAWAGGLVGAATVCLLLRITLHMPQQGWRESVFVVFLGFFPAACVTGVGLYLRSLDARRARAVTRALRDQRLEVARDLHDFVAHEVTGIVLEAQAAQLDRDAPQQTRELFERVEAAGLRALDSMDQTVRALRQADGGAWEEAPATRVYGLADLAGLLDRFSSMTRAQTRLSQEEGLAGALSREAGDAAYRVVLESLTNVRRHAAQATRVVVAARRTAGGSVEVTVTDDGGGTPGGTRHGGGTGLAGLSERVDALGGTLRAGPHGGGWRVGCVLPAPAVR